MKNLRTLPIALMATFYFLLFIFNSSAQSVGINSTGSAPDASALLDLSSTDKGFLITRVDTASITFPAFGLMTFAPTDSCLYLFNGINWMGMGGGGSKCSCNCNDSVGTPPEFACGSSFTDTRDNEIYGTVKIGDQCWMSKNLNYTSISGSWCYDDDNNNCNTYGRLYSWYTATNTTSSISNPSDVQGVCPVDWHIPSDSEWKELEIELGMSQADADNTGWRGTDQGTKLKTSSWNGTNSSGFTALPGGGRFSFGDFNGGNSFGRWWSTTDSGANGWRRDLGDNRSNIYRVTVGKGNAYSIRCVRD